MPDPKTTSQARKQEIVSETPVREEYEFTVQFDGTRPLETENFKSATPEPGFYLRFVQTLLNAGDEYPALLGVGGPISGELRVTVSGEREVLAAHQGDLEDWLLKVTANVLNNPNKQRKLRGTPRRISVLAVFHPAVANKDLAPDINLEQDEIRNAGGRDRVTGEEQLDSLLNEISQQNPTDFVSQNGLFVRLLHRFRVVTASLLQRPLNDHLQTLPQDSPAEKQSLARFVNSQLRELGLAIRCPKTARPSVLISDLKEKGSEVGRFRMENRDERGAKVRTATSDKLPELELMEDVPRGEPLVKWKERVREKKDRRRD